MREEIFSIMKEMEEKTFPIVRYTFAKTIEEWETLNENKRIDGYEDLPKNEYSVLKTVIFALMFLLLLGAIGAGGFISVAMLLLFMVIFALTLVYVRHSSPEKLSQSFHYFREKIIFSDIGIEITSPIEKQNHTCLYTDISDFILCYKQFNSEDFYFIAVLRWKEKGQTYQYTLPVPTQTKEKLLKQLNFLYEKALPITEIDEHGRKLYMLSLIQKKKVSQQVMNLIAEIGNGEA